MPPEETYQVYPLPKKFKPILNFIFPTFGTKKIKQGMRKPKITLAYDEHRNRGVVNYQKIAGIFHEWKAHGRSERIEIYKIVSRTNFKKMQNLLVDLEV
jgi:hypothetical protein